MTKCLSLFFGLSAFQSEYNIRLCFGDLFPVDESLAPSIKENDQKLAKCCCGHKGKFPEKQSNAREANQIFYFLFLGYKIFYVQHDTKH